MMALFDKFIRKWLFGLAVAVRNRAQAVIAGMESGEEKNGQDANRQAAPGAARPVRAGGPPAHWVRLVKRHAPELLHPGPPYAFPRESALAPEREGRHKAAPDEAIRAHGALPAGPNGPAALRPAPAGPHPVQLVDLHPGRSSLRRTPFRQSRPGPGCGQPRPIRAATF